jgi:restriction system protein
LNTMITMAIPDYQTIMLPLLRLLSDGKERSLREARDALADYFDLSIEERQQLLKSGRYSTFSGRVSWASTYAKEAGLIERPRRGYMKITPRGLSVLKENPSKIDVKFLERYPEFLAFRNRSRKSNETKYTQAGERPPRQNDERTPEETIESAYQTIRDSLAEELLEQIKGCSPEFFERLVVDLLVKMGYGGTRAEAGKAVGRSGDGGIDGIINEDRLGLDVIYIQAKRWEGTVSRPEIQKFVGALHGQKARKGIFITTSDFSKQAIQYASNIENNVVLIDGETLAGLMIDHDVGTAPVSSYEIKRIDSDYFEEV